jgi:flavodoxin
MSATARQVLVVYYTYTGQSAGMAAAMADVLQERGCDAGTEV